MKYNQLNGDFKNLLNATITAVRLYEPNDVQLYVKAILNASNIKFEVEAVGKSYTSNFSKTADKVIEFLLYSRFIERCGDGLYLQTEDRGVKLKEAGSFERYYEEQEKQSQKANADAQQSDLIRSLDLQLKEQQHRLNIMELNNKPYTFKIAVAAFVISIFAFLKSTGLLLFLWQWYSKPVK